MPEFRIMEESGACNAKHSKVVSPSSAPSLVKLCPYHTFQGTQKPAAYDPAVGEATMGSLDAWKHLNECVPRDVLSVKHYVHAT